MYRVRDMCRVLLANVGVILSVAVPPGPTTHTYKSTFSIFILKSLLN